MSSINSALAGSAGRGQREQGTSLAAFLASMSIASGLSIASLGFFLTFRHRFPNIYARKAPRQVANSACIWHAVRALVPTSKGDLVHDIGGDAATFLRFLVTMIRIFGAGSITIAPVLLSLNAFDGAARGIDVGMDQLSWGNIKFANQDRYWGHCICMMCFVAYILHTIDGELAHAVNIRQSLLAKPTNCHIVLVSDVPKPMLDKERIRRFYEQALRSPRSVENIFDISHLAKLISRRDIALRRLEGLETSQFRSQLCRNRVSYDTEFSASTKGLARVPRDTAATELNLQRTRVASDNERISKLQSNQDRRLMKHAFMLTFDSSSAAIALERCSAFPTPDCMTATYLGIEPADINWSNTGLRSVEIRLRRTFSGILEVCLILAWAIPIASTGVLSQAAYLAQITGSYRLHLLPASVLGLLEGVLPQLALMALMSIFPIMLKTTIRLYRSPSRVMDQEAEQSRYFLFLFINQFITVSVSSSAVAVVAAFLNRAESIPKLLASNIPKASNYFLSYIPLQALYCSIAVCLQPLAFFNILKGALTDKTARDKYLRLTRVPTIEWGLVYPVYTNLACIVLVYAPIAPIILPLAFSAFGIFWICFRFSVTSITNTEVESSGKLYPWALLQLYVGLYVGEACWLGLFILQISNVSGVLQAVCIGVLALVTIIQHQQLLSKYLPLLKGCTLNQSTAWKNTTIHGNEVEKLPMSMSSTIDVELQTDAGPLLPQELSVGCPELWIPTSKEALQQHVQFGSWLPSSDQGILVKSSGHIDIVDAARPPVVHREEVVTEAQ